MLKCGVRRSFEGFGVIMGGETSGILRGCQRMERELAVMLRLF